MSSAYTRKKQPELVRRLLLDCAARLAMDVGLGNLTVQAVAEAAGVTKGGLFHHFPSKQILVEAMFRDVLDRLDAEIGMHLAEDGNRRGCFTRAYVKCALAAHNHDAGNPWVVLSLSMMADPSLTRWWSDWLAARLAHHQATDAEPMLEVVRLAADGAWLAMATKTSPALGIDVSTLHTRLIALTER